jgi:tight adherence protein B
MNVALLLVFLCLTLVSFPTLAVLMPRADEASLPARRLELILSQSPTRADVDSAAAISPTRYPSIFDVIERPLEHTAALRYVRSLLLRAHSKVTAGAVLLLTAVLFASVLLLTYALTSTFAFAVITSSSVACLPCVWLRFKAQRRLAAFDAVLPDCIDMCARALQAGHSLVTAIGMVAEDAPEPGRTEFGEVFKQQNYGLPLRDALMQMLERVSSRDLQMVITGMLVQRDTGGNLVEIMKRISGVIRDRVRIQGEVRTHTAQGRLTGWILCLLPPALLVLINLVDPGYSRVLFNSPAGRKMLYTGMFLLAAGGLMIRRIIRGIEA